MPEYRSLIKATLEDLGANQYLVPGAKFLTSLQKAGLEVGIDFRAMLREEHKKLGEFLHTFEPEVVVKKRGQNDMLVGLQGAIERPTPVTESEVRNFRSDVYKAFSRVSQRPFVYSSRLDSFTQDETDPGAIRVPQITNEQLIEERREFAQTLNEHLRSQLMTALNDPNPLQSFQKVVLENKFGHAWRVFHSTKIDKRLSDWASATGLHVAPAWRTEHAQSYTDREAVLQIISYMNDSEIAQMHLPARAVTIGLNAILTRTRPR
jgi:hypothetical protein